MMADKAKIPGYIKNKMRKRHKMARALSNEITKWFLDNGVNNEDLLRGMCESGNGCEALTFIEYGEGEVEKVIAECEDWYREQK